MIRRHLITLAAALVIVDAVLAWLTFVVVSLLRFPDGRWLEIWAALDTDIRSAALLFSAGWVAATWYHGLYRVTARWSFTAEFRDILRTTIFVAAVTLALLYVFRLVDVSRTFLLTLFLVQPVVTLLGRAVLRALFGWYRASRQPDIAMLVVGRGELAQAFADLVERHRQLGIRVLGHVEAPGEPPYPTTRPVIGVISDIERIFHGQVVDEVAVCLPPEAATYAEAVTGLAASEGKTVRIPAVSFAATVPNSMEEEVEGLLIRSIVNDQQRAASLLVKRALDIVLAALALVLLSPVLLAIALLLRVREGRPVLFTQVRAGLHGRAFVIYKFRTMVPDAEQRYHELVAQSSTQGAAFKMRDDPRVTPLGRILRATSLDELPQLWNVLTGDMSIVGPRPAPPREIAGYDIWHRRRLSMKPGLTGLWQVRARFDEHFDERARLDLQYIDSWSLLLDLRIMLATIPALLTKPGH